MPEQRNNRRKKGFFGEIRLPVSKGYVYPSRRNALLYVGGVGAVVLAGIFGFNVIGQDGSLVSNGPLSSNHATIADNCQSCHTPFGAVSDDKCGTCHEKFGSTLGTYSFATHYAYRSGDFNRLGDPEAEQNCYGCHTEHVGRDADITRVADDQCLACHAFGSFDTRHPQFDFVADSLRDDANLKFPHVLHVNDVMRRREIDARDVEQACLYCHQAEPDGRSFKAISFDDDCSACHLNAGVGTPWLALQDDPTPARAGVSTIETLRRSDLPEAASLASVNANDFAVAGGEVSKEVVTHADPWILANLRRLRKVMYPNAGLADLLQTSSDVAPRDARSLYEEAVHTLQAYVDGLRAVPRDSVQADLAEAERLLRLVQRRLDDPRAPLNETRFVLSVADRNPDMSREQYQRYVTLVDDLTQPCQKCHVVANATILRVRARQDELVRANFNHRAHIIDTGCLDCHDVIPFQEYVNTAELPDPSIDNAGIFNLPSIETCQRCHKDGGASDACITCHSFHPDKSQHANLLRYVAQ